MSSLPFIDLKAQYAQLKTRIDARIQTVLDHRFGGSVCMDYSKPRPFPHRKRGG